MLRNATMGVLLVGALNWAWVLGRASHVEDDEPVPDLVDVLPLPGSTTLVLQQVVYGVVAGAGLYWLGWRLARGASVASGIGGAARSVLEFLYRVAWGLLVVGGVNWGVTAIRSLQTRADCLGVAGTSCEVDDLLDAIVPNSGSDAFYWFQIGVYLVVFASAVVEVLLETDANVRIELVITDGSESGTPAAPSV